MSSPRSIAGLCAELDSLGCHRRRPGCDWIGTDGRRFVHRSRRSPSADLFRRRSPRNAYMSPKQNLIVGSNRRRCCGGQRWRTGGTLVPSQMEKTREIARMHAAIVKEVLTGRKATASRMFAFRRRDDGKLHGRGGLGGRNQESVLAQRLRLRDMVHDDSHTGTDTGGRPASGWVNDRG